MNACRWLCFAGCFVLVFALLADGAEEQPKPAPTNPPARDLATLRQRIATLPKSKNFKINEQVRRFHGTGARVPANFGKISVARNLKLKNTPRYQQINAADLPAQFDVRDAIKQIYPGKDLTVRDQGQCGCCWIFGAVGAYECSYLYAGKIDPNVDASEQYLLNCLSAAGANGCDGGWPEDALQFLQTRGTTNRTGAGAFTGGPQACNSSAAINYQVQNFAYVSPSDQPDDIDPAHVPADDDIKRAIYTYGAVVAAVYATDSFQVYQSGVFDENATGAINHAIALVGWKTVNNQTVWLLRNSWGSDWGDNGYMWIQSGSNLVGFGAMWTSAKSAGGSVTPSGPCPQPTPVNPAVNANIQQALSWWSTNYPGYAK